MKDKIISSFKKHSKSFFTLLIVYILAKVIAHTAYKADMVPVALLGQLLVFSSYIYFIILLYKFFSSLRQSVPKPNTLDLNEVPNQSALNNQNPVGNTVASIGAVFSFTILAFVILIVLIFMGIGLGS